MSDDQPRPLDDLQVQLDRIEANSELAIEKADRAYQEARGAREESEFTNGRLRKVEDDLYGPSEERRRENQPGLIGEFRKIKRMVFDVVQGRDEAKAVRDVGKTIVAIGVPLLGMMIAALTLLLRMADVL